MNTKNKIKGIFAAAAIGMGAGLWQYNQICEEILTQLSGHTISRDKTDLCVADHLAIYLFDDQFLPGNRDDKIMAQTLATMIACQYNQPVPNLVF